jgi:tetratricopeptide (TPR) repeat protein
MKLILPLLLFFCSSVFAQKTQLVKDNAAVALNDGNKNYRNGSYSNAIKKYLESLDHLDKISKDPNLDPNGKYTGGKDVKYRVELNKLLAKSYDKSSNFKEAENYFNKAIALDRENYDVWEEYGSFLDGRNKGTEATNAYFNAIKFAEAALQNPNSKIVNEAKTIIAKANYGLGKIHQSKNPIKAVEYLKKAIEADETFWQAMVYLGRLYENEKKYLEMEKTYKELVNLLQTKKSGKYLVGNTNYNKQIAPALLQLGLAYFSANKFKECIATMELVLREKTSKSSMIDGANYYLGASYKRLSDDKKALSYLGKVKGMYKANADHEIDEIKNRDKYN